MNCINELITSWASDELKQVGFCKECKWYHDVLIEPEWPTFRLKFTLSGGLRAYLPEKPKSEFVPVLEDKRD